MLKKTISFVLVLAMLTTSLLLLPVFAASEPLTEIVPGGEWAEKTVVTADELLSNLGNAYVAYDKTTRTATQSGYSLFQLSNLRNLLRLNKEADGGMEISMTITPMGEIETIFPDDPEYTEDPGKTSLPFSKDGRAWTMRFCPYIDGSVKNQSDTSNGLNVKYDRRNAKMSYSFPWNRNTQDFVSGTSIPFKYVVEKKDGKLTAVNWAEIDGTWIPGTGMLAYEGEATADTGMLTSVGLLFSVNSDRDDDAKIDWVFSDISVIEKTPATVRLADLSENFYAQDEAVPVDFVLPEGYESASLTVDGEDVASFDPANYPAGAYTAKLNLGVIGKIATMDVVLSGTTFDGDFSTSTFVNSGIDPNYVPPLTLPAKVSFQNADGTRLTAISPGATVKAVAETSLSSELLVLCLYENKVLKAIKSGTGAASLTVPADVGADQVVLKAFVLNSLDDANALVRAGQWNSSDLGLVDILIDGKALEGYSDGTTSYNVELPASFTTWPNLDPITNDSAASAVISYSGAFPGTNTIALTAEDGSTRSVTLNYTQEAPEILNPRTAVSGKTLIFKTLEKPEFLVQPQNPPVNGTNSAKDQNKEYAMSNIKNPILLFNDRTNYYFVDIPDELVGATLVSPPYNSDFWSAKENNPAQDALMSFELTRSATVYVYVGNGFKGSWNKEATWISDEGWTQDVPFNHPIYMQDNTTSGIYSNHVNNWVGYQKHFEVKPWGEPVTVNIGAMVWSSNIIIVKFD